MRVLSTMYGSRGDVQPLAGLEVQPGALGAAAEERDAPVAAGVMPDRVWR